MNEQAKMVVVTAFLEGMYYVGKRPSLAEVGDLVRYLQRKRMIDGDTVACEVLVHKMIAALHLIWDQAGRGHLVSTAAGEKAEELTRLITTTSATVEWEGRDVVRVIPLTEGSIRLFFDEQDPDTHTQRYTDVPYTAHMRITR